MISLVVRVLTRDGVGVGYVDLTRSHVDREKMTRVRVGREEMTRAHVR